MQNCTFLVLLRPIFGEKMKTAPPKEFGCRSCEVVAVIRPEKPFELPNLDEKSASISVKTFFFFFFFFGDHLFLGRKRVRISDFGQKIRLSFGTSPILGRKRVRISDFGRNIRVILIQEQRKFGSRSLAIVSLF